MGRMVVPSPTLLDPPTRLTIYIDVEVEVVPDESCQNANQYDALCGDWAAFGQCEQSEDFMRFACSKSCRFCQSNETTTATTTTPATTTITTSTTTTTPTTTAEGKLVGPTQHSHVV